MDNQQIADTLKQMQKQKEPNGWEGDSLLEQINELFPDVGDNQNPYTPSEDDEKEG